MGTALARTRTYTWWSQARPQQHCVAALTLLNSSWVSLQSSQDCPAVESTCTLPKRSTAHSAELGMAAACGEAGGRGQGSALRAPGDRQARQGPRTPEAVSGHTQQMSAHPANQRQSPDSTLGLVFALCLPGPLTMGISFKHIKKYRGEKNVTSKHFPPQI